MEIDIQQLLGSWMAERAANHGAAAPFHTIVVYEDTDTNRLAQCVLDSLSNTLGDPAHLQKTLWKFEMLRVSSLQKMAADDAANANLIIVALQETGQPPEEVKKWIELWTAQKRTSKQHLMALFIKEIACRETTAQTMSYFEKVARTARVNFVTKTILPLEIEPPALEIDPPSA